MARRSRADISYAINSFERAGMTRNQALGALGSLAGESGLGLNTEAHNPNDPNGGSKGIGQWHSARRTAMEKFTKGATNKFRAQVDFVVHEITKTPERKTLQKMKANPNMTRAEAARTWTNTYERPNQKFAHHNKRAKNADYFAGVMNGAPVADVKEMSLTGANLPGNVPTPTGRPKNGLDAIGDIIGGVTGAFTGTAQGVAAGATRAKATADGGKKSMTDSLGDIGNFFGGLATGGLTTKDEPDDESFFGKPNTAAIIGTVAGGAFMGMPGAVVGGILGQAIGRSLTSVGQSYSSNGLDKDSFPDAPKKPDGFRDSSSMSGEDFDRARSMSPKAAREIAKGGGGLY